MTITERYVVYPDGDSQEIDWKLTINDLVDLNGRLLELPLESPRIIAYRVIKARREDSLGSERTYYHLELVNAWELLGYCN
jgi:hypothetical protein